MTRFALLLMVGVGLTATAFAADPARNQTAAPAAPTATFVASVAFGNQFEIDSGKLALERTRSASVEALAHRMVDDHSAAAVKFMEVVTETKLTAPPEKLDARHQAMLDELRAKNDTEFDKAYIDAQYKVHVETVDLFKGYSKGGENARLRKLAEELLPTLQDHLDHVGKMR
jgi:putative membrane protein